VDVVVTVLLFAVLVLAASASFYVSLFFAMATDACYSDSDCNEDLVGTAYAVAWGGVFVGVVGAIVGTVVAACMRIWMWIWPLLGTLIIVVVFFVGLSFADAVMTHRTRPCRACRVEGWWSCPTSNAKRRRHDLCRRNTSAARGIRRNSTSLRRSGYSRIAWNSTATRDAATTS